MRRGKPPDIFSLRLLTMALISASLFLSSANWHPLAAASAGPSPASGSITVTSEDIGNGTTLSGFTVDLRVNGNPVQNGFTPVTFSGLQTGVQYQVVVYWYGNYYFRGFSDGDLNRYALVTLNATQDSVSLTGLYQRVPSSQAASLNILAQFPNGTRIGTTFNNTDYIQHTPGMWLTVTPPGSTQPFTGSYTGGSILPFTLFRGQTYTVEMTAGYGNIQFLHWKDNNSTDLSRQVKLNGDASYTAIYVETRGTTSSTTASQKSSSSTTTTASSSSPAGASATTSIVRTTTISSTTSSTPVTTSGTSKLAASEFPVGPSLAFAAVLIAIILLLSRRTPGGSKPLERTTRVADAFFPRSRARPTTAETRRGSRIAY